MHAVQRCGLLLQMLQVAWSVCLYVGMPVCVLVTRVSCAKPAEPIEMPFGALTHLDPENHVLDAVKIGQIHSQPPGVTRCRCGLLPNCFRHHLFYLALNVAKANNSKLILMSANCHFYLILCRPHASNKMSL